MDAGHWLLVGVAVCITLLVRAIWTTARDYLEYESRKMDEHYRKMNRLLSNDRKGAE
jgi:hypothetical protein